jgi:hypothetical protein
VSPNVSSIYSCSVPTLNDIIPTVRQGDRRIGPTRAGTPGHVHCLTRLGEPFGPRTCDLPRTRCRCDLKEINAFLGRSRQAAHLALRRPRRSRMRVALTAPPHAAGDHQMANGRILHATENTERTYRATYIGLAPTYLPAPLSYRPAWQFGWQAWLWRDVRTRWSDPCDVLRVEGDMNAARSDEIDRATLRGCGVRSCQTWGSFVKNIPIRGYRSTFQGCSRQAAQLLCQHSYPEHFSPRQNRLSTLPPIILSTRSHQT